VEPDGAARRVGPYQVLTRLGAGAAGVVYKAEDTKLRRTVALKFLAREAIGDEEARLRFLQEARIAASLNHPNICTIHDVGEIGPRDAGTPPRIS